MDRHLGRDRRQRRDLVHQQVCEFLPTQATGQCQLAHRAVAGQLPAAERQVFLTTRVQPAQAPDEQFGEVVRQILDRHVRLRCPPDRLVHLAVLHPVGVVRRCRPVGERHRLGVPLGVGPPVERRQHAHVLVPGRCLEPGLDRPVCPVSGVGTQRRPQPFPDVKQPYSVVIQKHHPIPENPRVHSPGTRRRRTALWQLAQPLIHRNDRAWPADAVLKQQVASIRTGIPSGIGGLSATYQSDQPSDEKKDRYTAPRFRDTANRSGQKRGERRGD